MAVLGLILLVAAGALTAAVVTSNTGAIETNLWGITISNLSLGVIFVAGMLTTLVGVAGLVLMMGGVRRGRRLRQERRVLRRENERLTQQVGPGDADDETATYPNDPRYSDGRYSEPMRQDVAPAPAGARHDRTVASPTGRADSASDSGDVTDRRYESR